MKPAAAAVLVALAAAPALAQPALPVMAIAVERPGAPDGSAAEVDALMAALAEDRVVALNLPDIPAKRVKRCGKSRSWEGCIRGWLRKKRLNSLPVRLALVIDRGPGAEVRMTCIGPGRRWAHVPAHVAWVDLQRALSEGADGPYRRRVADCLRAASTDRGF